MKKNQCLFFYFFYFAVLLSKPIPVEAFTSPNYSFGEVYATSAYWWPDATAPDWVMDHDLDGSATPISISDGHTSSDIHGYYGVNHIPVPYRPASFGSVTSNAQNGSIQAYSGTSHDSNGGEPVTWEVQLPGTNPFEYQPFTWGEASSFGYIRSAWEITSSDGSLQAGDPVTIQANLNIDGILNGDTSTVRGMLFLNGIDGVTWLDIEEYIRFGDVEDLFLTPDISFDDSREQGGSSSISFPGSTQKVFQVGDVIVMEALLGTTSFLNNDGIERSTYADFANTLESDISVQTSGADLTPYVSNVPIPGAFWLFATGLFELVWFKRKFWKK